MKEHRPEPEASTLYIVSTPIGNLADITLRALTILKGVDLIAAEDTRTTSHLLRHYDIHTECISYFSHNELKRIPLLIEKLKEGKSIAVVSDAGTPGVSDPAALLISAAVDEGLSVVPIPGASAMLAALVSSGLHTERFVFEGFLPIKKRRKTRIAELSLETRTIILYESMHRLLKTLTELREAWGDRRVSVSRELTKLFEETLHGTFSGMIEHFTARNPKGEFVLVIEGASVKKSVEDAEENEELRITN
jgi:16S rRNA (cytidine1402-2'-O)-methyltransferase